MTPCLFVFVVYLLGILTPSQGAWVLVNSTGRSFNVIPIQYTTQAEGQKACGLIGGTLASIHSLEEHNTVKEQARAKYGGCDYGYGQFFMLGMNDLKEHLLYQWLDGTVFDYENFETRQPDGSSQRYIYMLPKYEGYRWHDWDIWSQCKSWAVCQKGTYKYNRPKQLQDICYWNKANTFTAGPYLDPGNMMTTLMCRHSCVGYKYAAVLNGNQCKCGNSLPVDKYIVPKTYCTKRCPGNLNEMCGGVKGMNIYEVGDAGNWKLEPSTGRSFKIVQVTNGFTLNNAKSACVSGGGELASIHTQAESNHVKNLARLTLGSCDYGWGYMYMLSLNRRKGDQDWDWEDGSLFDFEDFDKLNRQPETTSQNFLYLLSKGNYQWHDWDEFAACKRGFAICQNKRYNSTVPSGQDMGCYCDNTPHELFTAGRVDDKTAMTVEKCRTFCKTTKNAQYAGLQFGYQCYCSNTMPDKDKLCPATWCTNFCPGNDKQRCGGTNKISAFVSGTDQVVTTTTTTIKPTTTTPVKLTSTTAPAIGGGGGGGTTKPSTPKKPSESCKCIPKKTDCLKGTSREYKGALAQTAAGVMCQAWSSQFPHKHSYTSDSAFSDGSVAKAKNYCRDPSGKGLVWCYTNSWQEWDYCAVAACDGTEGTCK